MGLLIAVVVGLLVGALAGRILPGVSRYGMAGDLLAGAVGGLAGVGTDAWFAHLDLTYGSPAIVAVGLIGAVVVLNITRRILRPFA